MRTASPAFRQETSCDGTRTGRGDTDHITPLVLLRTEDSHCYQEHNRNDTDETNDDTVTGSTAHSTQVLKLGKHSRLRCNNHTEMVRTTALLILASLEHYRKVVLSDDTLPTVLCQQCWFRKPPERGRHQKGKPFSGPNLVSMTVHPPSGLTALSTPAIAGV